MGLFGKAYAQFRSWMRRVASAEEGVVPGSYISVNGTRIQSSELRTNTLTPEAAKKFEVDLKIVVVSTELARSGLPLVSPLTLSVTFFVPSSIDLSMPVDAPVCVVTNWLDGDANIAVYIFDGHTYRSAKASFDSKLRGLLGCTGASMLGMYLLKEFVGVQSQQLSVVHVIDTSITKRLEVRNVPVDDERLIDFCRAHGVSRMYIHPQESDCPYYSECLKQVGARCDLTRIRCLAKA